VSVAVDTIIRETCWHFNVSRKEMLGPRRYRRIARPRQMAMYLCRELTTQSLPWIGRRFGGRDHTTVLHAYKRIEELMLASPEFHRTVLILKDRVMSGQDCVVFASGDNVVKFSGPVKIDTPDPTEQDNIKPLPFVTDSITNGW